LGSRTNNCFIHINVGRLLNRECNRAGDYIYLIQFEHFLPTNDRTSTYASMRTTRIDNLQFSYDVKSLPDLVALLMEDSAADGTFACETAPFVAA